MLVLTIIMDSKVQADTVCRQAVDRFGNGDVIELTPVEYNNLINNHSIYKTNILKWWKDLTC